ncbi:MAG TPA: ComEC/Rec2 family competence protein, partial [bacterium]|nr:ComEC/Rec2 family competence protein [bacterium]
KPGATGRLLVSLGESSRILTAGDRVRVRLDPIAAGRNFSTEYRKTLGRRGIYTLARVVPADFSLLGETETTTRSGWPARMRQSIRRIFERQIPDEPQRSIMAAVSFGLQRPAAPLRHGFQRLGIYHLLVVSGLHVAYFNYFFSLLLLPFRPGLRLRSMLHLPALAFYAMLCGFSAPVLRATLMAGFHHLGIALNRESRPLNAISLAAFVLLVRDPGQLFEPGWQLTFVITGALVLGASRCRNLFGKLPGWLAGTLGASLAGQAAGLPLSALYFGQVPLLGLIVNPFFIPLAGLLVLESFLMIAAPWGRELFAAAGGLLSLIFVELSRRLAEWPLASLQVPRGNPAYLLIYLPLAALLILNREKDKIKTFGVQNVKEDDRNDSGDGAAGRSPGKRGRR